MRTTTIKYRVLPGLLMLLVTGVFAVDLAFLPDTPLPAPPYAAAVLIAAYFLPPPMVAGIAVWTLALQALAFGVQQAPLASLSGLYLVGTAFTAVLAVALSHRTERERLLAESEQRRASELEALVEQVTEGITIADPQGKLLRINPVGMRLWGFESEDEYRKALPAFAETWELGYPDGRPMPFEEWPLARVLRGDVLRNYEALVRRLDTGRAVMASFGGTLVRGRARQPLLAVLTYRDVTAQKRAEEERERLLREIEAQRELFQAIVEHAPVGIAVLRGPAFVYELLNPAYQAIAPGKAMLGETVAAMWPELAPQVLPLLEQVRRTGEPYFAQDARFHVGRAPTAPPEEAYFTFAYLPIHLAVTQAETILVLAIETTEQVRARQRIEELAELAQRRAAELQSVLDNMVDGVFVCNVEGRITLANEAGLQIIGLAGLEEAWRAVAEFPEVLRMRHPDGRPVLPAELPLIRALAGRTIVLEHELIHNLRTQRDVYVRTSAAPIRDRGGQVVGAVEVTRDVTELAELDRLKDQFISVAAHELKTPVTIMKGYAQALLRTAGEMPASHRRMLEAVDRGADWIQRIVTDLLDISQLQLGHLELAAEAIDLPELVGLVVDRLALAATTHRIRLVRAAPVVVRGDRDRLEQVVANLVDNAIKHSPRGGDVEVTVAAGDHEAVVTVKDQGVGIPRDKQDRIFQRFYRAHVGTPYDYGGMGIGLYISKEIVARHGGRIWFQSEEGRGSIFSFSLPLARERA